MSDAPFGLHQSSPAELRERLAAERRGSPLLVFRDGDSVQRIVELGAGTTRVTIGRSGDCDVALPWDAEVSRLHAEIESSGGQWLIVDDGLSSNGTFVAGERVSGRRRLRDGDVVRLGPRRSSFATVRREP